MKASFVTWQLRRLHSELDAIDKQRGNVFAPRQAPTRKEEHDRAQDRAARRALLERILRSLPKRLGFRDARSFADAFARANKLFSSTSVRRGRLSAAQIRELERRVLNQERPADVARSIGCAEQTVLNRASQLRKRLANSADAGGSGI